MTINQILAKSSEHYSKIKLNFLQIHANLKQILAQNQDQAEIIQIDYKSTIDLDTQLSLANIDTTDILGLVYKYQNSNDNTIELFFLKKLSNHKDPFKKQNSWLTIDQIEDNYTGTAAEIASLYALGYADCLRAKYEVNWYPVE